MARTAWRCHAQPLNAVARRQQPSSAQHFWVGELAEFEVWFAHAPPVDTRQYEETFAPGVLRFAAPWNGFKVATRYTLQPVPGTDPKLHELIRKHADAMLSELPTAPNLAGGPPSLGQIARALGMSERTHARHLEEEGTAFMVLLDDLRTRLALRYVRRSIR